MTKVFCAIYILAITALSASVVGELPKETESPYSISLPITIFFMLLVPALLGYISGRKDSKA